MKSVVFGFRASRGGSIVVAVSSERSASPHVIASTFLSTGAPDDRLAREPFHVAAEIARSGGESALKRAEAAVREGRARQNDYAAANLRHLVHQLEGTGWLVRAAALIVNRAGWVTDLMRYSLGSPSHPPVAEGLAVRDAIRYALRESGIVFSEIDEKTLLADPRLASCTSELGRPWRKEQRLASLAAWIT